MALDPTAEEFRPPVAPLTLMARTVRGTVHYTHLSPPYGARSAGDSRSDPPTLRLAPRRSPPLVRRPAGTGGGGASPEPVAAECEDYGPDPLRPCYRAPARLATSTESPAERPPPLLHPVPIRLTASDDPRQSWLPRPGIGSEGMTRSASSLPPASPGVSPASSARSAGDPPTAPEDPPADPEDPPVGPEDPPGGPGDLSAGREDRQSEGLEARRERCWREYGPPTDADREYVRYRVPWGSLWIYDPVRAAAYVPGRVADQRAPPPRYSAQNPRARFIF